MSGCTRALEMVRRERVTLKGGMRVRSLVEDVNVSVGLEGMILNVTPQYMQEAKLMVLWANDTRCYVKASTVEVVPVEDAA